MWLLIIVRDLGHLALSVVVQPYFLLFQPLAAFSVEKIRPKIFFYLFRTPLDKPSERKPLLPRTDKQPSRPNLVQTSTASIRSWPPYTYLNSVGYASPTLDYRFNPRMTPAGGWTRFTNVLHFEGLRARLERSAEHRF
jgi:hypothetical protein